MNTQHDTSMRIVIRVDGDKRIGGGHIMRCLTLAEAARARGHDVEFVTVAPEDALTAPIRDGGFALTCLAPEPVTEDDPLAPSHADWLRLPWQRDARLTAEVIARAKPDWLIWDHYGLDARWVEMTRAAAPSMRVLAIDDLDDRPLASDLLLDQTRINRPERAYPVPGLMIGPEFALLRPEFAKARPAALANRRGVVGKVLVAPGMMDAAGLAPIALKALAAFPELSADVVMSARSQSAETTAALCDGNDAWTLTLDARDVSRRMAEADLCIGAGGMTSWERCCLGLPTIAVSVALNQIPICEGLEAAAAVVHVRIEDASEHRLAQILSDLVGNPGKVAEMSRAAARLCDGTGAARVIAAIEGDMA